MWQEISIAHKEIAKHLSESSVSENTDSLHYWEVHSILMPILAQLVVKYLAILASSASVERLFSVAGLVPVFKPDSNIPLKKFIVSEIYLKKDAPRIMCAKEFVIE